MKVLIWDVPTRLFHWLFALSFAVAWLTEDFDRYRDVHVFAGYLTLALLGFRLVWGIVGSRYARFSSFRYGLAAVLEHLRGLLVWRTPRYIGHTPAGSWAIYAMLALGLLVGTSGLMVLGGEEGHGIFGGVIPYDWGRALREMHEMLAVLMLLLVFGHIAGVIVESRLHRENLTKAMVTGRKEGEARDAIPSPYRVPGVAMLLFIAGWSVWFFSGYLAQTPLQPYIPFVGKPLPDNKAWREECGGCHLAFHPVLLPARSWVRMMLEQNDHFGEALHLDAQTAKEIADFLYTHAAETGMTEAANKINESLPAGVTPLRITETPYWKKKHGEIPDDVWRHSKVKSKANCPACHLDAEQGWFEDAAMRLPRGIPPVAVRE